MKIIKRDGRVVDYNREKIEIAIEKANTEVRENERANKNEIKEITKYIEELNKKRILVEDIQDIIEQKLMEKQKYELAKKYIVYRYTRALVRRKNTTDESILGLIKNNNNTAIEENKNTVLACAQRNYIAGEVSKDLTKRMLLPEKITKAHENGILHFHGTEYFLQPMINSSLINIEDMLENGTVINGNKIENPKGFQVACTVTTQIIADVASNQYGDVSLDIKCLGKYLRKSKVKLRNEFEEKYKNRISEDIKNEIIEKSIKEELSSGVQTIQYQISTITTTKGDAPHVTLYLNLDESDEYIEENALIIEEILKQRYIGIKNAEGIYVSPTYPKLVYVLHKNNILKKGKYDYITNLAIKCSKTRKSIYYLSAKKMKENYKENVFSPCGFKSFLNLWKDNNENYKFNGRFNQGVVTINLPQIAIESDGDEVKFWNLFDEKLELCFEALMCRHYALLGTISEVSPIHWKYGAIARLKDKEEIDELLKNGYSNLSLGYIGLYEVVKIMKDSQSKEEKIEFAIKLIKHMQEAVSKWEKQTGLGFILDGKQNDSLCRRFAKIDREKFGIIKDVTDKEFYTNSYNINTKEKMNQKEKLELARMIQEKSYCGIIADIKIDDKNEDENQIEEIIEFLYENIQYAEL